METELKEVSKETVEDKVVLEEMDRVSIENVALKTQVANQNQIFAAQAVKAAEVESRNTMQRIADKYGFDPNQDYEMKQENGLWVLVER